MRNAARRAFSLIELLVVIGIIAVLIALLLAARSRTRVHARSVQCQSNLRSIGQAMLIDANAVRAIPAQFGTFLP
jgi:prepilin-type N-terminal cleavage/methylation domain-containing protein